MSWRPCEGQASKVCPESEREEILAANNFLTISRLAVVRSLAPNNRWHDYLGTQDCLMRWGFRKDSGSTRTEISTYFWLCRMARKGPTTVDMRWCRWLNDLVLCNFSEKLCGFINVTFYDGVGANPSTTPWRMPVISCRLGASELTSVKTVVYPSLIEFRRAHDLLEIISFKIDFIIVCQKRT